MGAPRNFFIAVFIDANSGLVFDSGLLTKLAKLKIELGLDLYPPDKKDV